MSDEWIGWHFLNTDKRLRYGDDRLVVVGETLRLIGDKKPVPCVRGFHACHKAMDALIYAPGPIACKVRLSGEIVEDGDKAAALERTVLAMADATNTLHEFACWCAEQVVHLAGRHEAVCRYAIETKRRWIKGEATDRELTYARTKARDTAIAAKDTAWPTSWSAWSAFWAAENFARAAISSGEGVGYAALCTSRAADNAAWVVRSVGHNHEAKLTEMLNEILTGVS